MAEDPYHVIRRLCHNSGPMPGRRLTAWQRARWAARSSRIAVLDAEVRFTVVRRRGPLEALEEAQSFQRRAVRVIERTVPPR